MKSSILFPILLFFCLFCGLFHSCADMDDLDVVNALDESNYNSYETDSSVAIYYQQSNPLDWVGQAHNDLLDTLMIVLENSFCEGKWENITFRSPDHYSLMADIMHISLERKFPDSVLAVESFEVVFDEMYLDEWFDGQNPDALYFAENVLADSASRKDSLYTMNLLNALFNVSIVASTADEGFAMLDSVISEHEVLILNETWKDHETFALGTLAVAKYSNEFWSNHPISFSCSANPRSPDPRSTLVVCADAAGYAAGGVVGATSGSVLGPAGTFGGLVGGKFLGAWVGSGAAGTAILIYDSFMDFFGW